MCTAIVSIDPGAADPVLLIGVRDEFLDRAWDAPAAWWPREFPGLLGGRDRLAGGTWLAVDPAARSAACVLNGHGTAAPERGRRSRGGLPLLAAVGRWRPGDLAGGVRNLAAYDPFHLVLTRLGDGPGARDGVEAWLWSWDGTRARERRLGPGLHIVVNSGLEGLDDDLGIGTEQMTARIAYFRPLFETAKRPEPTAFVVEGGGSAVLADTAAADIAEADIASADAAAADTAPADTAAAAAADTAAAWGDWLAPAQGAGLGRTDPRALVLSREFEDGRLWGTASVSLVALGAGGVHGVRGAGGVHDGAGGVHGVRGVRYDFGGTPGDPEAWQRVY